MSFFDVTWPATHPEMWNRVLSAPALLIRCRSALLRVDVVTGVETARHMCSSRHWYCAFPSQFAHSPELAERHS